MALANISRRIDEDLSTCWVKTINGNRPYNLEDRLDKILGELNITLWSNAKALYMSCDHEYKIKGDLGKFKKCANNLRAIGCFKLSILIINTQ